MALICYFDKTKIMIFGTRQDQRFNFNLVCHKIDICTDFKYLGVIFSRNRPFQQTKKHNVEQARKAMHVLFKRIRNLDIPIDLRLYLFDHVILPIALYERRHAKRVLNVIDDVMRK